MFGSSSNKLPIGIKNQLKTKTNIRKIHSLLNQAIRQYRDQISTNSPRLSPKRRSDDSSESETMHQILANLTRGYLMIKHSQNTRLPHNKFVYLSQCYRFICWKSLDRNDEKRIQITQISRVVKDGAQFYLKGIQIKNIERCVIIQSASRNLQLQAANEIEAEVFKHELDRVLKYSKGMRLNYKYHCE